MAYLAGTKELCIYFKGYSEDPMRVLIVSSDASYALDIPTRKSHYGSLFLLFNGPVDWKALKQPIVTTSSTEVELLSLSETAKQAYWWERFFKGI